jgi:hypothetical protein
MAPFIEPPASPSIPVVIMLIVVGADPRADT